MKSKFIPKTKNQLMSESVREIRESRAKTGKKITNAIDFGRSAVLNPEETAGNITKSVAKKVTTAPLSTAGYAAGFKYPGVTEAYVTVSPYEQRIWDYVNRVGAGNYTVGRITKPIRGGINNYADSFGRAVYRQANML